MLSILTQASLILLMSTMMGMLPLGMGLAYAIWPSEQRLALMRPLSLATIFAALCGSMLGLLNVLRGMGSGGGFDFGPAELSRVSPIGLAEALVPLFVGFGCLTVAWLGVALGLWRRA